MLQDLGMLLIGLIALEHIGFLILEMFFWDKQLGLRVFRQTPERAASSKALAANQGLYNGFLAAGLIWALFSNQEDVALFFLVCVAIAGVFGAATVSVRIFFVQALPALIALALMFL